MARTNKLKLAVSLIENEVTETNKKIEEEAKTGHYGKACGFQKHKEGLLQALGFVKVCGGKDEEASSEDKD
jgi:hypothetical protein